MQQNILRLTARYGLMLRPVLDRLYFDGIENGCEKDLAELRRQGLLKVAENAIADPTNPRARYSYYTLTRKATALLGVSEHLGKESGPEAVARNLAILWFCTMRPNRSHRLEGGEVADLLHGLSDDRSTDDAQLMAKGYYCLSHKDQFRLLNTYVPRTTVPDMVSELRKRITRARKTPVLDMAMKSRQFGFLILVETKSLRDQLWEEASTLASELKVKFLVHHSPGPWKAT